MKKIKIVALAIMLAFLVTIPGFTTINADETLVTPNKLVVFKIGDYNYYTQDIGSDKINKIKMDVAPLIKDDRTFVPVRFLSNALGVSDSNIDWNNQTRTAVLKGQAELKMTEGVKAITTNGKKQTIDVAPFVLPPGRTMLPARYVAEGLGYEVDWEPNNRVVYCWEKGKAKPDIFEILKKIDQPTPGAKKAVIDTSKYGKTLTKLDGFPEFYRAEATSKGVHLESNSKHRFVCTNYPEMNEYEARAFTGGDYIERNDDLTNIFSVTYGKFKGKLKEGMVLEYDVFDEAGNKIYDLTLKF